MLELGVGADIVRGIGTVLWVILALALLAALFKPQTIAGKVLCTALVLGIFFGPIIPGAIRAQEHKKRYEAAKALFDERCKTAGEKIYRTVEGVDAVELIDTRGKFEFSNYADPNWKYAGFPGESSGDKYIKDFLFWHATHGDYKGSLDLVRGDIKGYQFVEVEAGEKVKQFSLLDKSKLTGLNSSDSLEKLTILREIPRSAAAFAVVYENIIDPEGRTNWIAGGRTKVIEKATSQILGEFTRYAFDPTLGSTAGGRSPWAFAHLCQPPAYPMTSGHIRSFVEQVIKPIQEK